MGYGDGEWFGGKTMRGGRERGRGGLQGRNGWKCVVIVFRFGCEKKKKKIQSR